MRFNQNEIIDDILEHIRQCGGDLSEWCVGTARNREGPIFQRYAAEDFRLIYREAYTTYAAEGVVEHLVQGCGLHTDHESSPGKVVFVSRHTETKSMEQSVAHSFAP